MHEERRSAPAQPLPSRPGPPFRVPLPTDPATLPALPDAFRAAIAAGCAAWAIDADEALMTALEGHARLLLAWTRSINLTSIRDPERVAVAHVLDSLSAVPLLRRLAPPGPRLVDLGSGGGYPGLPLAVALPAGEAVLVESVGKKARFLEAAVAATAAALPAARWPHLRVDPRRAEALAHDPATRGHFDVVAARAVGSLAQLVMLGLPLLRPGGILLAWKSDADDGRLRDEIAAAGPALVTMGGAPPLVQALPPGVADLSAHRLVAVRRVAAR